MKTISELKKDLVFNREMSELMDILKKTATFEFQSLFNRRKMQTVQEKYVAALEDLLKIFSSGAQHPFLTNPRDKVILVVITSDMGFVGGLNTEVVDTGLREIRKNDELHLLALGEKGYLQLEEKGYKFEFLPGMGPDMNFSLAEKVRDYIYASCWKYKVGRVVISYPKFISFAHQEIATDVLVPCGHLFKSDPSSPDGLSRPDGRGSPEAAGQDSTAPATTDGPVNELRTRTRFLFEPSSHKVLDYLLKTYLAYKIYDIFWQAKLSEFAARSMHLDGSMQELTDMKKGIQSQYFRSKHEITDRTIRDIFGGRMVTLKKLRNA
ncbi:MAG TPA: F0F1 ATP synthase subunit gamma [Planctomycetota bacterium]|nr:F0F1 ATP synthase subunit gamma [Planctomycetota bacterium]